MKTSDKLSEAYNKFRPHINGHRTAMNLFFEALREVEEMEQELSKLHQPTVSGAVCEHNFVPSIKEAKVHTCVKCSRQRVEIAN